ncbi:putative leucine-rich repeat domain superfamily [Helianthus annuus]|uniref:Leucine-rich repeat domain superfamily n=1 Tax=Helianthus annuus TaxID=4232 RepID=A0A251TVK1_HELAN|nr:putative leucine-rich repeat domain superfamily [Helianthus annuus]
METQLPLSIFYLPHKPFHLSPCDLYPFHPSLTLLILNLLKHLTSLVFKHPSSLMNHSSHTQRWTSSGMSDVVFECVIPYIHNSRDRQSVSLVCRRWYELEAQTRKHVMIALCYAATPAQLSRRFPYLESIKLKGKPRAAMYNLIPEDWGGSVTSWVEEIARSFTCLKVVHFRRMIVTDEDLQVL